MGSVLQDEHEACPRLAAFCELSKQRARLFVLGHGQNWVTRLRAARVSTHVFTPRFAVRSCFRNDAPMVHTRKGRCSFGLIAILALQLVGCARARSRTEPKVPLFPAAGAVSVRPPHSNDQHPLPTDPRCWNEPNFTDSACPGDEPGYYAQRSGPNTYTCVAAEPERCTAEPLPFPTLEECLATCAPQFDAHATECAFDEGSLPCDPDKLAVHARVRATTPYGALKLDHAWIDHTQGSRQAVTIHFQAQPAPRDVLPALTIILEAPSPGLVGKHLLQADLEMCSGAVQLPVRVTITRDELTTLDSERIEGTIESVADDVTLQADFQFDSVCIHSSSGAF
jgi:hypothetical protein